MAFNQYGYNPFLASYGTYRPQGAYAPHSGYSGYSAYNVVPRRYGMPVAYQPIRFAPQQAPQIIYMMPAPQPPQKWWDWRRFSFNIMSIAAGIGVAGIFCTQFLPKAITSEFMKQIPKNAKKNLDIPEDTSLLDGIQNILKSRVIHLSQDPEVQANVAQFGQGALDKTFTGDFLRKKAQSLYNDLSGAAAQQGGQAVATEDFQAKFKELTQLAKNAPELAQKVKEIIDAAHQVAEKAPGMVDTVQEMIATAKPIVEQAPEMAKAAHETLKKAQAMVAKAEPVVDQVAEKAPGMVDTVQEMIATAKPIVEQAPEMAKALNSTLGEAQTMLDEVRNSPGYKWSTWTKGTK